LYFEQKYPNPIAVWDSHHKKREESSTKKRNGHIKIESTKKPPEGGFNKKR
jgi:hypothetical protein